MYQLSRYRYRARCVKGLNKLFCTCSDLISVAVDLENLQQTRQNLRKINPYLLSVYWSHRGTNLWSLTYSAVTLHGLCRDQWCQLSLFNAILEFFWDWITWRKWPTLEEYETLANIYTGSTTEQNRRNLISGELGKFNKIIRKAKRISRRLFCGR